MERIGTTMAIRAMGSATEPSPQGSGTVVPRRRIDATNVPIGFNHFADSALPNRLWSAFTPTGGGKRTIRRAMREEERGVLKRRAAELAPALLPFQRPEEDDRVASALAELFDSFRSMREKGEDAVARVRSAMEVLSDLPAWAIEQGCLAIRRWGYEVREGERVRLEQNWAPSDGQIHAECAKVLEQRKTALVSATALLAAPIEEAPVEREAKAKLDVEGSLAEYHRMVDANRLAEMGLEAKRRDAIMAETRKRNLESRRAEYVAAGLQPPASRNGVITSLPMMLKEGWTIQGPPGQRVLVPPPRVPAPSPRETQPQEMGS